MNVSSDPNTFPTEQLFDRREIQSGIDRDNGGNQGADPTNVVSDLCSHTDQVDRQKHQRELDDAVARRLKIADGACSLAQVGNEKSRD